MALTAQQVKELKGQLEAQIASLPAEKRAQAQAQIDALSDEEIESMLEEQKQTGPKSTKSDKSIFRMIVDKEIKAYYIDENKEGIAVLDINPVSKGHTIIIPSKAVTDVKLIPTSAFKLAKKIAKKIESKLKAKSVDLQTESKFGEAIINLVPSYDVPVNINSPRTRPSPEDLDKIASLIKVKQKPKIEKIKIKSPSSSQILKLNRRIP